MNDGLKERASLPTDARTWRTAPQTGASIAIGFVIGSLLTQFGMIVSAALSDEFGWSLWWMAVPALLLPAGVPIAVWLSYGRSYHEYAVADASLFERTSGRGPWRRTFSLAELAHIHLRGGRYDVAFELSSATSYAHIGPLARRQGDELLELVISTAHGLGATIEMVDESAMPDARTIGERRAAAASKADS